MAQEKSFLKEFRGFAKEVLKRLGALEKDVKVIKFDRRQDRQEEQEFNERLEKKVDMLDDSVKELNARVRYQEDMPERVEQVEKDAYELKRRVAKVETST